MHGVQGCFASHLCSSPRQNKCCEFIAQGGESLTRFLLLTRRRHRGVFDQWTLRTIPTPILTGIAGTPPPSSKCSQYPFSSLTYTHTRRFSIPCIVSNAESLGYISTDVNFNCQPWWPGTCGKDGDDLPLYESWTEAVVCISVESGPKEGANGTVLSLPTCQTRSFGRHP